MRQISRQEDYGIFLMNKLAKNYGRGPVSLTRIAEESNISVFFLKHLASKLKKAGLVASKEGIGGGYVLTRSPKKITVGEIVSAFSGPLELVECCGLSEGIDCKLRNICHSKEALRKINRELVNRLNSLTLASI
jgi:Rrf2 family protein